MKTSSALALVSMAAAVVTTLPTAVGEPPGTAGPLERRGSPEPPDTVAAPPVPPPEPEPPPPPPVTTTTTPTPTTTPPHPLPSTTASSLASIRACESGGDYAAVSASGTYRGAYQFSRATWAAMGGSGDPAEALAAEQDARAAALLASEGLGQWPVCGR